MGPDGCANRGKKGALPHCWLAPAWRRVAQGRMYQEVARRVEKQGPRGGNGFLLSQNICAFSSWKLLLDPQTLNFAHCAGAEPLLPSAALE